MYLSHDYFFNANGRKLEKTLMALVVKRNFYLIGQTTSTPGTSSATSPSSSSTSLPSTSSGTSTTATEDSASNMDISDEDKTELVVAIFEGAAALNPSTDEEIQQVLT